MPFWRFEPARVDPNQAIAYYLRRPDGRLRWQPAPLTDYRPVWHARSPGHRTYCYAGLAISSLAVAGATASTHSCLPTEGLLRLS